MTEIGYCGDDCSSCPRYMATVSNDITKFKDAAMMWKRVGWRGTVLDTNEIKCGGCKTVQWCRYNDIRECAIARHLNNCGECYEYPCNKLDNVFKKTASYAKDCEAIFSKGDFAILSKAFFTKKNNLNLINKNLNNST